MRELVRRDFLKASGAGLGAALAAPARPARPSCRCHRPPAGRTGTRRAAGHASTRCSATCRIATARSRPRSAARRSATATCSSRGSSTSTASSRCPPSSPGRRACVTRPRPSSSTTRTAAATTSGRRSSSRAAATCSPSLREGAHRRGLRGPVHRPLVLRRAQPRDGDGHLQGHALAGAGALGNDGLRLDPRARLAADARRRGRLTHRDARHVDGQLHGPVAGQPSTSA